VKFLLCIIIHFQLSYSSYIQTFSILLGNHKIRLQTLQHPWRPTLLQLHIRPFHVTDFCFLRFIC